MLKEFHLQMMKQALQTRVAPGVLEAMVAANLGQDSLLGLVGHDEYHFDNNAFAAGYAYMETQRQIVLNVLGNAGEITAAWQAFGRLTHAAQDFYAHSNYITLWREQFAEDDLPAPSAVAALDEDLLQHPELRSGKVYFGEAVMYVMPFLTAFIFPRLPDDSHAKMNLDSPQRGAMFPYAIAAATQRTEQEFELLRARVITELGEGDWEKFCNG